MHQYTIASQQWLLQHQKTPLPPNTFHLHLKGKKQQNQQQRLNIVGILFQNAYSYSQWYQQYGAAYGHAHQE